MKHLQRSASWCSRSPRSFALPGPAHRRRRRDVADRVAAWCRASAAAMLFANSTAILTDAFPANERGTALGINSRRGDRRLVHRPDRGRAALGGRLAAWSSGSRSRSGSFGTVWAYYSRCTRPATRQAREDRLVGQHELFGGRAVRAAGRHHLRHPALRRARDGLANPWVLARADRRRGAADRLRASSRRSAPRRRCSSISACSRIRPFWAGNLAGLLSADEPAAACSSC